MTSPGCSAETLTTASEPITTRAVNYTLLVTTHMFWPM